MNNVYCIPTYVIWMGLLIPLKRINPDYYYKIEGIFFHWLLAIVSMWSYSAGYDSMFFPLFTEIIKIINLNLNSLNFSC